MSSHLPSRPGAAQKIAALLCALFILGTPAPTCAIPAETMTATIYDDGFACPADCDPHVVFAKRHNGTPNAFAPPSSNRAASPECEIGQSCVLCFGAADSSCIEAVYRGSGPPSRRFDFSPAFFAAICGRTIDLPPSLRDKCRHLDARQKHYSTRINCFVQSDDPLCHATMAEAKAAKDADTIEREACLREGESRYNARQADAAKRRDLACNYEKTATGRNSKGATWRKLLPGACREGSYVGTYGTDCCSGGLYASAGFHPECSVFFPHHR